MKNITKIKIFYDDFGMNITEGNVKIYSGARCLYDDFLKNNEPYTRKALQSGKITKDTEVVFYTEKDSVKFKVGDIGSADYMKKMKKFWLNVDLYSKKLMDTFGDYLIMINGEYKRQSQKKPIDLSPNPKSRPKETSRVK